MSTALNTLLAALVATPGNTCEEKMETLIGNGTIFTPNLDSMRGIARGFDRVTIGVSEWVAQAGLDIEVTNLSKRLNHVGVQVSPQKVREQRDFYSPEYVAGTEDLYRRMGEMRFPRRRRVARL